MRSEQGLDGLRAGLDGPAERRESSDERFRTVRIGARSRTETEEEAVESASVASPSGNTRVVKIHGAPPSESAAAMPSTGGTSATLGPVSGESAPDGGGWGPASELPAVTPRLEPRPDSESGLRYRAALRLVRDGQLSKALVELEAFVQSYPRHPYTDNAIYWIGEVHYMRRDYVRALEAFDRVFREHGDGNRAPDALLKKALCHERIGEPARARSTRRLLQTRYPGSDAAQRLSRRGAS